MFPAEGTDGIDDLIHLSEGHTMHPLVQILKSSLHRIGVGVIALMVIGKEHLQDGVGIIAEAGQVLRHMAFKGFDILIHPQNYLP